MKLSKAVAPAGSVGAFAIIAVTAGVLMIQNAGRGSSTPIVDQHVAAVSSVGSTSHALAKPAAVVPRSSVVVKKPATIQGATVTDPASTDSAAPTDPATSSAPLDSNAPPPPTRPGAPAGPTCWNAVEGKPC